MTAGARAPGSEAALDALLSEPLEATRAALARCPGDVIVLGAGGKMGPTIARMLRNAATDDRRIIAVSRWSSVAAERGVADAGIETVRADLLERRDVERLPDAPNVVFMAGQKFGTAGNPASTWAMNVLVPAACAERYATSRLVAFSTGNVYPLVPVASGGAREDGPTGPVGEYAQSCLGRERVLEHAAERRGTRVAIVRLNYANDLRYGVLTDLAVRVHRGEPVPLAMGHVNVVWQGDANRAAIECLPLAATPPFVVNVTGREALRVRALAEELGRRLGKRPVFEGREADDALLSDTTRMHETLGDPEMPLARLLDWVAAWVREGRPLLGKPTRFETRSGEF